MPIHDWTRVDAGLFHAFHHRWIDAITDSLNDGLLPDDHYALPEQRIPGPIPDVLTLRIAPDSRENLPDNRGGLAVADAPVRTSVIHRQDPEIYGDKADYIAFGRCQEIVLESVQSSGLWPTFPLHQFSLQMMLFCGSFPEEQLGTIVLHLRLDRATIKSHRLND